MNVWTRFIAGIVHAKVGELLITLAQRVSRLETQQMELLTELEAVKDSHIRFMKRQVGQLGGRPPGGGGVKQSLDAIPHGDKDALRLHFADEIKARGRRTPTTEQ